MNPPINSNPMRWQQISIALMIASLYLITLFTLLKAGPMNASDPFSIVTVILQEGDMPANSGGLSVALLNPPMTNGTGQVGFSGTLDNGSNDTEFIWFDNSLTWLSTSLISELISIEPVIGLSNNGNYAFSPLLENNTDSIWTDDGILLTAGDPAPGIPGYYIMELSRPTMQNDGRVNWFATISDTPGSIAQFDVLYQASDLSVPIITPVLQGGAVINGITITDNGLDNDYFFSDNGDHLITLIQTTDPITQDNVIYLDGSLLLREGDPTGTGDNWDNFDLFQVNNSGNFVVSGDTDGSATSDEFIAYNGVIQVREGDTIGGVTLASTANVRQLSLNNLGQAAFTWSILGGQEILFFACDSADLANATAVLATDDQVDTNGDGMADATIADFNLTTAVQSFMLAENGHIYLETDLDYGSGPLETIIRYTLPSCTGNTAPIATNDSYSTTQATPLIIPSPGVLTNDVDGGGDPLTAVLIQTPAHGTVDLSSSGAFTYTSNAPFFGTDSFTYRAFDGLFVSNLTTVFITVTSNNLNPGLQVTPLSLESSQPADTILTQTLYLTNTDGISHSWAIDHGPTITYKNGPLVNLPRGGPNGNDASILQNLSLDMAILGFGNSVADNNRLADEFTINDADGWLIDDITFYAYQTNSPITSTITAVTLRIWDGPPDVPTSTIVFGDTTTNRLLTSNWSGVYRISESTFSSARPIMASTVAADTFLSPGTYWLDWLSQGSSSFSGPWAPPIVISDVITTGNSLQLSGGVWSAVTDTSSGGNGTHAPQGFPFYITGQVSDCTQPAWVSVNPISHTLGAGMAEQVTVTFDSTGLGAGTYTGELCFTSSDSKTPFLRLPITLTSQAPAIILTSTVGTSPTECATSTTLFTPTPVDAYYCHTVTNSGNISLTLHNLEDSQIGTILNNYAAIIAPGSSFDTVTAGFTLSTSITTTTATTTTWVAFNSGPTNVTTATDSTSVVLGVPEIVLTPTVGTNAFQCASESMLVIPIGTIVHYCYTVTNIGQVPLATHSLNDSAYGTIFSTYTRTLNPGASFNTMDVGITNSVQIMTNTVSTAVWTASNGPLISITATGATTVSAFVVHRAFLPFMIRP